MTASLLIRPDASLSISIGNVSTLNSMNKHVERLRDFPTHDLPKKSLHTLELIVESTDLPNAMVFNPMDLSAFVPAMKDFATVYVLVVDGKISRNDINRSSINNLQPVHTAFLLAGLQSISENKRDDGMRVLSATHKPPIPASSSTVLLCKKSIFKPSVTDASALPYSNVYFLADDLLDEDDLLSTDVLAPPPAITAASRANDSKYGDDCGGRKACDNCTCGRAELEAQMVSDEEKSETVSSPRPMIQSSACGKCNLGDAFRCASCPYLGKPAFKAGEEHLVLDLQDDL